MSAPLVFRIRKPGLRERFERYVAHEEERTGYRLDATTVAERLLDDALTARGYGELPKRGKKP